MWPAAHRLSNVDKGRCVVFTRRGKPLISLTWNLYTPLNCWRSLSDIRPVDSLTSCLMCDLADVSSCPLLLCRFDMVPYLLADVAVEWYSCLVFGTSCRVSKRLSVVSFQHLRCQCNFLRLPSQIKIHELSSVEFIHIGLDTENVFVRKKLGISVTL
jgi:hypothetical protein